MARGHAASFAEGELFGEDVDLDFGSGKNAGFDWFRASSWPAAASGQATAGTAETSIAEAVDG